MDFNSIIALVTNFLNTDLGAGIFSSVQGSFDFLFPANSPAIQ